MTFCLLDLSRYSDFDFMFSASICGSWYTCIWEAAVLNLVKGKMGCSSSSGHPLLVVIGMTGEETTVSKTTWKERRCETFQNRTVWCWWRLTDFLLLLLFCLYYWDSFIQSCEILFLSGNCLFTEFCCLHTCAMLIKWYELCILLLWGNKINCLIFLCAFVCPFSEPRNKRA